MYASVREYPLHTGINTVRLPMNSTSISFMVVDGSPKLFVLEAERIEAWEERRFILVAGGEVFMADEIFTLIGCFPDESMFWHLYELTSILS